MERYIDPESEESKKAFERIHKAVDTGDVESVEDEETVEFGHKRFDPEIVISKNMNKDRGVRGRIDKKSRDR